MNPYIAGTPVVHPPHFVGRTQLLGQNRGCLFRAKAPLLSVSFTGARRFGKTSLLRRLQADALAWDPNALVVEWSSDEAVMRCDGDRFETVLARRLAHRMREVGIQVPPLDPVEPMKELLILAEKLDHPVYLFLDEFQGFIHRWSVGFAELSQMRGWIQRTSGRQAVVIASLEPLSEFSPDLLMSGLPGAIQLVDQRVEWMSPAETRELVTLPAQAEGLKLPTWAPGNVHNQSGGHPFYAAHSAFALVAVLEEGGDLTDQTAWLGRVDEICRPHLEAQLARVLHEADAADVARLVANSFATTDEGCRNAEKALVRAGWVMPNQRLARPVGALMRRFLERRFGTVRAPEDAASEQELIHFDRCLEATEVRLRELLCNRYLERHGSGWESVAIAHDIRARILQRGTRGTNLLDGATFGELFQLLQQLPDDELFSGTSFDRVSIVNQTKDLRDGRNHLHHHVPVSRKLLREAEDVLTSLGQWLARYIA